MDSMSSYSNKCNKSVVNYCLRERLYKLQLVLVKAYAESVIANVFQPKESLSHILHLSCLVQFPVSHVECCCHDTTAVLSQHAYRTVYLPWIPHIILV